MERASRGVGVGVGAGVENGADVCVGVGTGVGRVLTRLGAALGRCPLAIQPLITRKTARLKRSTPRVSLRFWCSEARTSRVRTAMTRNGATRTMMAPSTCQRGSRNVSRSTFIGLLCSQPQQSGYFTYTLQVHH